MYNSTHSLFETRLNCCGEIEALPNVSTMFDIVTTFKTIFYNEKKDTVKSNCTLKLVCAQRPIHLRLLVILNQGQLCTFNKEKCKFSHEHDFVQKWFI